MLHVQMFNAQRFLFIRTHYTLLDVRARDTRAAPAAQTKRRKVFSRSVDSACGSNLKTAKPLQKRHSQTQEMETKLVSPAQMGEMGNGGKKLYRRR